MTFTTYVALSLTVGILSWLIIYLPVLIYFKPKIGRVNVVSEIYLFLMYVLIHSVLAPVVLLGLLFNRKNMTKILMEHLAK